MFHGGKGQLLTTPCCSLMLSGVGVEVYVAKYWLGEVNWVGFGCFPVVTIVSSSSRDGWIVFFERGKSEIANPAT